MIYPYSPNLDSNEEKIKADPSGNNSPPDVTPNTETLFSVSAADQYVPSEHLTLSTYFEDNPTGNLYGVEPLMDQITPTYAPSCPLTDNEISENENVHISNERQISYKLGRDSEEEAENIGKPELSFGENEHIAVGREEGEMEEDNDEDKGEADFEGFDREEEGTKGMIADIFGESDADEEEEFEGFAENEVENEMAASAAVTIKAFSAQEDTKLTEDDERSTQLLPYNQTVGSEEEEEGDDANEFISDFDQIMSRRREENRRKRRLGKDEEFLNDSDDIIRTTIGRMRAAAEEDRHLLSIKRPATKKLSLLPVVSSLLNKADIKPALIDNGILSAITEWLSPLSGHIMPNVAIRDTLLRHLGEFNIQETDLLSESGIGKAVMYLYMHPKETRKNKNIAGHLINNWSRPIFNLTSDYRTLSKEERKQLDYEHLPKRRNCSNESVSNRDLNREMVEQQSALRPGDPGWVNRARVPQPSNKDYVVRPKWKLPVNASTFEEDDSDGTSNANERRERECQAYRPRFTKKADAGGASSRIETHIRTLTKKAAALKKCRFVRAVPMSVEGRKMSL